MARRSKRIGFSVILAGLLFLAVLSMVFLALVFRRGDTFHPESKKRYTILFSKRVIAQACSMVFSVWDPYAQTHRYAVTSPEREVAPDPQTPALETLKALQDYFDSSISSGSITARVTVKAFRNGDLPQSCFRFYYQRAGESKLDSLNRLYGLRAVFKADSIVKENDFIQLDHLMRWLHDYLQTGRRMESDIPKVDFNFNALDILYRAGQGERFICSEYSTTLVQCLASIGYTARYVMLNSTRGGHVACEAWSDSYDKWVLLDPYFCRTVTADGIPLSVYQVHRLLAE
ncbi:MAG: transglutaminase domain-containing protein, partial [Gemmatimonadota bacterium]|nr:transglutaminase domain-containing protein [Gemmatimonadota bacterium]